MDLPLPTVTVDDLRDFHTTHFPHAPAPEHILSSVDSEPAEECYEEEANALGCYEDSTPRTLTDEQIAMFRHSEIQAIIRKRRLKRENGNGPEEEEAEDGEAEESVAEGSSKVESSASQATPAAGPETDKVATGRVDKLKSQSQQWATSSPRTKARNKRNRDKYKAKKRDERFKREQTRKLNRDEDDESDEWDPWHQAKGPDVQKDDTVDLDY
ncbi:uncharacterized protein M421DRAFT_89712 [Didymella exigua CBS 183.55]|uniref:Uncharacterized protein n=1 Tax=Didymella exigua CBS 183.55 TaxID=1150837 RepID=A0A6A5S4J2_9PLEO|nr:uncharacterized protein M421DRAFT_89712 [Didymella exigua CBS 183.55]KAF1932427.1 hypothetical protein M421DRAFT_89712 [Didymella exigua CBS 183.55]